MRNPKLRHFQERCDAYLKVDAISEVDRDASVEFVERRHESDEARELAKAQGHGSGEAGIRKIDSSDASFAVQDATLHSFPSTRASRGLNPSLQFGVTRLVEDRACPRRKRTLVAIELPRILQICTEFHKITTQNSKKNSNNHC